MKKELIDGKHYWIAPNLGDTEYFPAKYFKEDNEFCIIGCNGETVSINVNSVRIGEMITQQKEDVPIEKFISIYRAIEKDFLSSFIGIHFDAEKYAELLQLLIFKLIDQIENNQDIENTVRLVDYIKVLPTRKRQKFFVKELYEKEKEKEEPEPIRFAKYLNKLSEGYRCNNSIDKIYSEWGITIMTDVTCQSDHFREYSCKKCGHIQNEPNYCFNCGV